ncbi:MAG: carotenoid 1,2-hydratase [Chloroflexi bacterium]|nr:carotenoid 1,2-hydratase [Chloroflexota bacterium]
MTRRTYLYAMLLLAAIAVLAWLLWPRPPVPVAASLVAEAAAEDTTGFARVERPRPLVFPADQGPHEDFQTEWWYYTGNLTAETGEHFGYQLTFFRRALTSPAQRSERASAWAANQVYMAHFAITDVAGGTHHSFERFARGAAGLAGAQADPFRVWLEDWSVAQVPPSSSEFPQASRLLASSGDVSLDLTLRDLKGIILQGDRGYSRKGPKPGNASLYFSQTRIASEGAVTVRGKTYRVSGLSWMDREISTSALGPEQIGWDWFSLQLSDGSELMVYLMRRGDGGIDPFSSGTLIAPDGTTRQLTTEDIALQVTGRWRSPRTGGDYPAGWLLSVPSAGLRLTITPWLADQEMDVSLPYWEGAVKVAGAAGGREITGAGYVELAGYAKSMQGQF